MESENAFDHCIAKILLRLLTCKLDPGEAGEAVREFAEAAELDSVRTATLVRTIPEFPREFVHKWVSRFVSAARANLLEERLKLMCEGSIRGDMLVLVEFFEFLADNGHAVRQDLSGLARAAGENPEELILTLEALSMYAEHRIRSGKRC